jgi:hypothetical protein
MARPATAALVAAACLVAGSGLAWHHPVSPLLCLMLLGLGAGLVAWRPQAWLVLLPVCLPWLNFSPWTGWLMADEFDILLLGVLAGGYARRAWERPLAPPAPHTLAHKALLAGVALTGTLALLRGLADAGGWRFDWFADYSEALNSIRVFKSLGFALLFVPLWRRAMVSNSRLAGVYWASGIVGGLALAVLAMTWERAAFPGLLEFSDPYRTVGLFWEMHVGGAAIDTYLAITAPFLVWALVLARRPGLWLSLALLALLNGYACLTTFSRGVYLAVLAPLGLLALLLWLQKHGQTLRQSLQRHGALRGWRVKAGLLLSVALLLEVILVLEGGDFMAKRLANAEQDLTSRMQHWRNGLGLLHGPADGLLGKGLGRLPANYAAQVPGGELPGAVRARLESAPGQASQSFVSLYGPKTRADLAGVLELTQRVTLTEPGNYSVRLDVRVSKNTRLELYVCERHLLYDRTCQSAFLRVLAAKDGDTAGWQTLSARLTGPSMGPQTGWLPRLQMFSIGVLGAGTRVDVDNLSLISYSGQVLLVNGDFSEGLAHWFPAAQAYFVPWHLDNLFLEMLVERGGLGCLAWMLLVAYTLWQLLAGRARDQPLAPYLAASLVAVLLVGLVSSVMDVPRVAWLFWMTLFLALEMPGQARDGSARAHFGEL